MRAGPNFRAYLAGLPAQPTGGNHLWRDANGQPVGRVYSTKLTSAFQPIVRLEDGATVAWDALIRTYGPSETSLHPWNLFSLAASEHELIELDRLCRILHTLGFFSRIGSGQPLHVKVHERLLRGVAEHHGQTFRRILDRLGIGRDDVVIELPHAIVDNHRLMGAVTANYRLNGFPVAVNFGPRNAERLRALLRECSFEILKAWTPAAGDDSASHDLMEAARGRRIGIVFTRVETREQLASLARTGATHAQGNLFAPPGPRPMPASDFDLAPVDEALDRHTQ